MFDLTTHAWFSFCFFTIKACFYCFYIKKKKKKFGGEDAELLLLLLFSFDSFSDIVCIFV
jgi:hypothetical protein